MGNLLVASIGITYCSQPESADSNESTDSSGKVRKHITIVRKDLIVHVIH